MKDETGNLFSSFLHFILHPSAFILAFAPAAPVQRLVRLRPAVVSTYSQSFFSSNSSIL